MPAKLRTLLGWLDSESTFDPVSFSFKELRIEFLFSFFSVEYAPYSLGEIGWFLIIFPS
jgi:hypothetical protein